MFNEIAKWLMIVCAITSLVVLLVGFIKARKIKKKRKKDLGYDSLTSSQSVNILKTKSGKYFNQGRIPTGLNDLFQELNRNSATGYVKYLNKLVKKHRKGFRFYTKKRVDLDKSRSNEVMYSVGVFVKSHPKLFTIKPNTTRVY